MAIQPAGADTKVFVPSVGRYLATEIWTETLVLGAIAGFLYYRGTLNWRWASAAAGVGLAGILLGAVISRRSRRLTIGDSWISGPCAVPSESATIPFSTLDLANSGFRKQRLDVRALGGQRIVARMAWFSSDTVEEIRRLVRERCGIMTTYDR